VFLYVYLFGKFGFFIKIIIYYVKFAHSLISLISGVESMRPWGVVHGCCGGRYGFGRLKPEKREKLEKIIDDDLKEEGDNS
jgi:hypothetical protein